VSPDVAVAATTPEPGAALTPTPAPTPATDPTPAPAPAPAPSPTPAPATSGSTALPTLRGVNLSAADFDPAAVPGTFGANYTYPTTAEIDHFTAIGMTVFRLPFLWERLQHSQLAALDATELARIDQLVSYATGKGAYVLLDPHNYARYFGGLIGQGVPASAFADFWSKLAEHFKANDHVIFGIMNEPNTMSTEMWLADATAAIAAIRAAGATQLIFVPGNAWTGAWSWLDSWYGTANATVMLGVVDPLDNYAFEMHQYLDATSAGTDMANCVSATIGSERIAAVTQWLAQHQKRAFLGEFGAGTSATCLAALDDLLTYMDAHSAQWIGWTYWAAGPWWGNAVYSIEPVNGRDAPQTGELLKHVP
jgi:endoglucanase